jgi:hypothetical protein
MSFSFPPKKKKEREREREKEEEDKSTSTFEVKFYPRGQTIKKKKKKKATCLLKTRVRKGVGNQARVKSVLAKIQKINQNKEKKSFDF